MFSRFFLFDTSIKLKSFYKWKIFNCIFNICTYIHVLYITHTICNIYYTHTYTHRYILHMPICQKILFLLSPFEGQWLVPLFQLCVSCCEHYTHILNHFQFLIPSAILVPLLGHMAFLCLALGGAIKWFSQCIPHILSPDPQQCIKFTLSPILAKE